MKKLLIVLVVMLGLLAFASPALAWSDGWQPQSTWTTTKTITMQNYLLHNFNGPPLILEWNNFRAHINSGTRSYTFTFWGRTYQGNNVVWGQYTWTIGTSWTTKSFNWGPSNASGYRVVWVNVHDNVTGQSVSYKCSTYGDGIG